MIHKINATVLLVEDLEKCTTFYRDIIGLKVTFSDDVSIGFQTKDQDFLLLKVSAAAQQISPEAVGLNQTGAHRMFLCAGVENVDADYQALMAKGVAFIKPPIDQAWGRRTAYLADPEGNLWELYHELKN
jgi:lactoylglutathione lyase